MVIIAKKVQADLDEARDYPTSRNNKAADKPIDRFVSSARTHEQYPKSGRMSDEWTPKLRGFSARTHLVFYRREGSDTVVIRFLSGRRDITRISRELSRRTGWKLGRFRATDEGIVCFRPSGFLTLSPPIPPQGPQRSWVAHDPRRSSFLPGGRAPFRRQGFPSWAEAMAPPHLPPYAFAPFVQAGSSTAPVLDRECSPLIGGA